jgi:hypothetical protein
MRNTTVIDTHVDLNSTRISRNDLLYKNKTSLVHTAQEVKKYIKSVFGALSPQAKPSKSPKYISIQTSIKNVCLIFSQNIYPHYPK